MLSVTPVSHMSNCLPQERSVIHTRHILLALYEGIILRNVQQDAGE